MARRALRIMDGHLHTHRDAVSISITAPGEESGHSSDR
jgi:hypothetical protein